MNNDAEDLSFAWLAGQSPLKVGGSGTCKRLESTSCNVLFIISLMLIMPKYYFLEVSKHLEDVVSYRTTRIPSTCRQYSHLFGISYIPKMLLVLLLY